MPKREYTWESIDNPPEIGRHSLNKHEVIKSYLERYLNKLYGKAREYIRFSIVDGFAGGGLYVHNNTKELVNGSPLILLEATREADFLINKDRQKPIKLDVNYFFIE